MEDMIKEEKMVQEALIDNAAKYGWFNTIVSIDKYCNDGQLNTITTQNNARKKLSDAGGPRAVYTLMLTADIGNTIFFDSIDFREFIFNYLAEMHLNREDLKQDIDLINHVSKNTIDKYGVEQAKLSMMNYLRTGNLRGFANDDGSVKDFDLTIERHFQFRSQQTGRNVNRSDVIFYMLIDLLSKRNTSDRSYLQYSNLMKYLDAGASSVVDLYMNELNKNYGQNNQGFAK